MWIPEGDYVDLTELNESTGSFERIHAQAGWHGMYNKSEWWHSQFKKDKQPTFLDEMESIGYTEARLGCSFCVGRSAPGIGAPPRPQRAAVEAQ